MRTKDCNAYSETTDTPENNDQYLAYFKLVGPVHFQREAALLQSQRNYNYTNDHYARPRLFIAPEDPFH